MERFEFVCTADQAGSRLDKLLAECMPGHSRSALAQLIAQEAVLLNGRPAAKSAKPAAGDRLEVLLPDPDPMNAEPENIPLDIVYEDDRLLVVNKPKGMVVHPAPGNYQGTLVNALLYHCAGSLSGIGGQLRPGIVHRIDKNTSGLLVVAKDDAAHTALSAQMACHSIHRLYQAVVYGGFKQDSGFVEGNIGRSPQDRKKMALVARGGKPAYTGWQVLDRYKGFTHLQLQLKTGRTHQIRVHMASIGHPVAGDDVYGPRAVIRSLGGQCLHAKTLGFVHPGTGEYMEFDSPLPEYFTQFLQTLKREEL